MDSIEQQNQQPAAGTADVAASESDVNVVDFDSAGVNSDDVGISLPDVEEMKTDMGRRSRKTRQCWTIGIAVICLLAIVIGLSVGLTGNNSSASSASANSGDNTTSNNEGNLGFDGTGSFDRYMQVYNALSESEISAPESLKVMGTPANLACNWMANGDDLQVDIPASLTEVGGTSFLQRYVLSHMYFHLKGPAWTFGDDFLTKKSECNWNRGIKADGTPYTFGVSCEDGKAVSQIFMPGNNMDGSLPAELGLLTALTHLSLYQNNLVGSIPDTFAALTNLRFFAAENNQLEGTIPAWIQKWRSLEYLALGNNLFTGSFPLTMGKLTNLIEVSLYDNVLTGDIGFFADIPTLHRLFLGDNTFNANLNDDLFSGAKFKELDLANTGLTGSIPPHFFEDEILQVVDLHGNKLSGSLPSELSVNNKLKFFSVFDNRLTGSIPTTIQNLQILTHIDLSGNRLDGPIPDEITNMTDLTYLYLANNAFDEGPFPSVWDLENLEEFSLKNTQLTGTIPTEIGLMTGLILMDLGRNQLKGKIPKDIGKLTNLRFLILNSNFLTGTMTIGFRTLESIELLLLDDTSLTGGADHVCGDSGPKPGPTIMSADCREFNCTCCTYCCAGQKICYEETDLLSNIDLTYEETFAVDSTYKRTDYVFSENIEFRPTRVAQTDNETAN